VPLQSELALKGTYLEREATMKQSLGEQVVRGYPPLLTFIQVKGHGGYLRRTKHIRGDDLEHQIFVGIP